MGWPGKPALYTGLVIIGLTSVLYGYKTNQANQTLKQENNKELYNNLMEQANKGGLAGMATGLAFTLLAGAMKREESIDAKTI